MGLNPTEELLLGFLIDAIIPPLLDLIEVHLVVGLILG
jgi:hypothetical protein